MLERLISCRLDYFLVSESIMMAGREINVMVLPSSGSNDWPLSFEWERIVVNLRRPFRFETFWLLKPDFLDKLKEWWEDLPSIRGTRMYDFQQNLKLLKNKIKKWNSDSFGNSFREKKELDSKIQEVQQKGMQNDFSEEI